MPYVTKRVEVEVDIGDLLAELTDEELLEAGYVAIGGGETDARKFAEQMRIAAALHDQQRFNEAAAKLAGIFLKTDVAVHLLEAVPA